MRAEVSPYLMYLEDHYIVLCSR